MAIYHLSVKYVSRKQGRSAVGAAAYRAGVVLHNEYDGLTHDYTDKRGIAHTEILLPDNAPQAFQERQTLWNAVESAENRSDARTAREIEIALPRELSLDEQIKIVREYAQDNFVNLGMCADISIHRGHRHRKDKAHEEAKDDNIIFSNNPHAHILLTDRPLTQEGFCKNKDRDWNNRKHVYLWRKEWEKAQNREFERKGLDIKVSSDSYIKQGIDKEPTKHLGAKAAALEQRGIHTDRGNENRAIQERNRQREERNRRYQQEREQNRSIDRAKRIAQDLSR